ncbi:MAG: STN domain-containing protein [Fimbriimonadaceae bacterium]
MTLAALAAATVLAQWPFALPLPDLSPDASATPSQAQKGGKVTLSGDAVPAKQVFEQLRRAGANFVIDSDAVPADKKLSLNLVNQDPESAVKAVANALGMSATKEGDILILAPRSALAWESLPFGKNMDALPKGVLPFGRWKGDPGDPEPFPFEWKSEEGAKSFLKQFEHFKDGMVEPDPGKAFEKFEFRFGEPHDFLKIVESLMPSQRELHKKQGFLRLEDLTPQQKQWLGNLGGDQGEFEVTFSDGDKNITIRSK